MAILTRETTATGVTNNGAPLTNAELDNNFVELQQNKVNTADLNEAVDDRVSNLFQAGLGIDLTYDDVNNEFTIDSNHVEVACTNQTGASIPKGTAVYQTGVSGNNITIAPADADDAAKMPAIGLTTDTIADTAEGTIVILGVVTGLDTSAYAAGDTLYVSTTAGALSTSLPTGETGLIQNFGRVLKVNASSGAIAVMGAGRSNAVPNLNDGNVFIGNASNQAETRALVEADISDLQTYLTAESDTLDSVTGRGNSTSNSITVGDATVTGDLTVQGTTTTLNTATLNVEDKNITINYSTGDSSGSADGAGITIQDAVNSTTDATILWDATGDKFEFSHAVDVTGNITVSGTVDGRDIATDGSKLDGIEASADVTDATNVAAAGAIMDGDFTVNGFMKRTGAGTYTVDTSTYLTSYTETDTLDSVTGRGATTTNAITVGAATVTGDLTVDTNTLYVDSTNNRVGIGTDSPSNQLHIASSGSDFATLRLDAPSNTTPATFQIRAHDGDFDIRDAQNTATRMTINADGNVGIGVSSPNHKLTLPQVDGTSVGMDASSGFTLDGTSCTYYGLTYQNRTGTGFNTILSGYDNILFATLGIERCRIDSSGNLLVGTTASSYTQILAGAMEIINTGDLGYIDIKSSSAEDFDVRLQSNSGAFYVHAGGSSSPNMVVDTSGRVGIGETAPDSSLHIDAGTGRTAFKFDANTQTIPAGGFGGAFTYNYTAGQGNVNFWNTWETASSTQGGFDFRKKTGASSSDLLMSIRGNGNVGIGVSDPDAKLEIFLDDNDTSTYFHGGGFRGLKINDETISNDGDHTKFNKSTSTGTYSFNNNNGELVRIDGSGNLTATSSIATTLDGDQAIRASSSTQSGWKSRIISSNAGADKAVFLGVYNGIAGLFGHNNALTAWADLYINTTSANGSAANTYTGALYPDSVYSYGNVTAYSDERLKSDIETLDGSKVYEMRGVSFTKDGKAGSGVIAQELQKVAPELVHEGEEYLSVAYGNLVGYLIEAVKELKAEIEELKNGSS